MGMTWLWLGLENLFSDARFAPWPNRPNGACGSIATTVNVFSARLSQPSSGWLLRFGGLDVRKGPLPWGEGPLLLLLPVGPEKGCLYLLALARSVNSLAETFSTWGLSCSLKRAKVLST